MTHHIDLDTITVRAGAHPTREDGVCEAELVAYYAGEVHSDHPQCLCPVIGAFIRSWNDSLHTDEDRNRLLRPLTARLAGTRSTREVEIRRSWLAFDWLVREQTAAWLQLGGLNDHAVAIRSLPEIRSAESIDAAIETISAALDAAGAVARDAARDAAWDAALDAAGAVARDAARDAAWDAAWDAAGAAARAAAGAAASDAALDAAGAVAGAAASGAAWAASWDAAGAAAREASAREAAREAALDASWEAAREAAARAASWERLAPTVASLQESALELIDRMIEVQPP